MDDVTICNMALASMGGGTRNSISCIDPSDGSTEADFFALFYEQYVKLIARSAPWNCLRKQASLSVLQAAAGTSENPDGETIDTPPRPWTYAYAYPSDCVLARFILPYLPSTDSQTPVLAGTYATAYAPAYIGSVKFLVANSADDEGNPQRVILTNMQSAELVYTAFIEDPDMWDVHYQQTVVTALCALAVDGLARNNSLATKKSKDAKEMIIQARLSDGNEGETVVDYTPDWIAARHGATDLNYGQYYGAWETIMLPGLAAF